MRTRQPIVSAAWLRQRREAGDDDLVVVDVRCDLTDRDWGRARYLESHLPGAVFADTDRQLSGEKTGTNGRHPLPDIARMAEVFGELGIAAESQVVAYDDVSGMFAARLWWMLRYLGHPFVSVLDGGLPAWLAAGGKLEPGDVRPAPRTFLPHPQAHLAVGVTDVEAGLGAGEQLLLDAREPVRWRGEREPLDPVAGRIPGARNHFWKKNVADDGAFRSPEELRREFAPITSARGERRIVCYCGSGITAAHNALALEVAGIGEDTAVYSGSWSEWCANPERPVERDES